MESNELVSALYESVGETCTTDPDVAHIEIHGNKVLGVHLLPGLEVDANELDDGIEADIRVREGTRIDNPVRICFGVIPETGVQKIYLKINLEDGSRVPIAASCSFPNAVDVLHTMDAEITVGKNANYMYVERHVHGTEGGVRVIPKSKIILKEGARFRTDFELIKGMVGNLDIDLEAVCEARAVAEMSVRASGRGEDRISINEKAELVGDYSRAVLTTNIAVRGHAKADIKNTIIASGAFARGHVDCKEIVQDQAIATAIPIVDVRNPKAHVTHEAAIGSVDSKQLETLMSRGLDEDAATDLIIEGLLSPSY
jgi:hypothetical protein